MKKTKQTKQTKQNKSEWTSVTLMRDTRQRLQNIKYKHRFSNLDSVIRMLLNNSRRLVTLTKD